MDATHDGKKIAVKIDTPALGDTIASIPTLRKISQAYGNRKLTVFSSKPSLFIGHPLVSNSKGLGESTDEYKLYHTFEHIIGKQHQLGEERVEFRHPNMDIRQFHAVSLGFVLMESEMETDLYIEREFELPFKDYIIIHPTYTWPTRTWEEKNWQELVNLLNQKGIPVVAIGRDSKESGYFNTEKPVMNIDIKLGINLLNDERIDIAEIRWMMNRRARAVVTMDSGILHVAGTTDVHIIQLSSSIDWRLRAPYRKGSQKYKYSYVDGGCERCSSDMGSNVEVHGTIHGVPPQIVCLKGKTADQCHPKPVQVLSEILKTSEPNVEGKTTEDQNVEFYESDFSNKSLVKIRSNSLGDTIGAMAVIDAYRKKSGEEVSVICKVDPEHFKKSYPEIKFYPHNTEPFKNPDSGVYDVNGEKFGKYTSVFYDFKKPLMQGYADQFGINSWERPKMDLNIGERPIKSKYVCFSMHSTAQAKHWNYPNGWDILCRMLRKSGLTPVCIDFHSSFGIDGNWNTVPSSAVKKQEMNLKEVINYLHHSEFFIGISSGLSWVAHAIGKNVVMISGFTEEEYEFSEDVVRIINKKVCNGCFNKQEVVFDASDWMWCPFHKNTDRQFECTKTITPEDVMKVIDQRLLLNI